jgi:hypothetical protein
MVHWRTNKTQFLPCRPNFGSSIFLRLLAINHIYGDILIQSSESPRELPVSLGLGALA